MAPPLCKAALHPGGAGCKHCHHCFLSVLISRTSDERVKFQVATVMVARVIAACVNICAGRDAMDAYPNFAAMRTAPPHHACHELPFELQNVYVADGVH
jgi:hypothetical protein